MTSRLSFFRVLRMEQKQLTWLTALQTALFFLLIPFRVLLSLSIASSGRSGQNRNLTLELCRHIGLGRSENRFLILLMGIICAVCAFSYLYSQIKLDFYHSLPLRREYLFAVKSLASILTFLIPYLCAQVMGLAVGAFYGAVTIPLAGEILISMVQDILFFLCSFGASLLAVMLTGKLLTTVLALLVFLAYGPVIVLLVYYFIEVFLTSLEGLLWFYPHIAEILRFTSPWAFCYEFAFIGTENRTQGLTGTLPTFGEVCQLIAIAAILFLLALWIYRRRRSEAEGSSLAFRRTEGIFKILIGVPVSLIAAILAESFAESVFWDIFLLVLFGALFCMLMEFIYRWDISQALMHRRHIVITVLLSAAIFFSFREDLFRINTYLPAQDEIASMAVAEEASEYRSFEQEQNQIVNSTENPMRLLDRMETDQFEPIYRAAEDGVSRLRSRASGAESPEASEIADVSEASESPETSGISDESETSETSETSDSLESSEESVVYIYVKYHLKNGKERYRDYTVDEAVYDEMMRALIDEGGMKETYYPVLAWKAGELLSVTENWNVYDDADAAPDLADRTVEVPASQLDAFLDAYQQDLRDLSWDELKQADEELQFTRTGSSRGRMQHTYSPIGESFARSWKMLQKFRAEEEMQEE